MGSETALGGKGREGKGREGKGREGKDAAEQRQRYYNLANGKRKRRVILGTSARESANDWVTLRLNYRPIT